MSGSRWGITPSWLSGSWRSSLYSSSVYSYHLFLISSASIRSIPFLSCTVPFSTWNVALISTIFLHRCLVFPILLFSSTSLCFSFKKSYLYLLAILWNSAFSWAYLSLSLLTFASSLLSAICKVSSDNHFASLHFFYFGMVLLTASCIMLWTSFHSSGTSVHHL